MSKYVIAVGPYYLFSTARLLLTPKQSAALRVTTRARAHQLAAWADEKCPDVIRVLRLSRQDDVRNKAT